MTRLPLLLSLLVLPLPLSAQEAAATQPQRLVRLVSAGTQIVGVPITMRPDTITLLLRSASDTLALATSSLGRVEQLVGRHGFARRGRTAALIGGSIGAALGLVGGLLQDSDAVSVPGGLAGGVAAGGLVGLLAGGLLADGRIWQEVPREAWRAGGIR